MLHLIHSVCMPSPLPRQARWNRFAHYCSIVVGLPQITVGSAPALSVSWPAQRSLALQLQPTDSPSRLMRPSTPEAPAACCLHRRSDCYRVERSSSRAGLPSRCGPAPFTAHCYLSFSFGMVDNDIASLWPPFDMAAIQSINTRSRRGRCSSAERSSSSRSGRTPCAGGIRSSALQFFPLRRSEPHEPKCLVAPA